jgi:NAD(P)-dependent dehydrogenase (short-subunit alcohol dehydrogenase family)
MSDWDRKPGFDLNGKRALVVGCGNPAGRAIALGLAEAGADVAIASATLDGDEVMEAKWIARDVSKLGRKGFSQGWDVTLPTNVQVGLKQLEKEFGSPSVLVFNADAVLTKPLAKTTDREFGRTQAVNQSGAVYAARSFIRELPEGGAGRIIFVTSLFGERGMPNLAAYGVAKGGLQGLMANLCQEVGPRGVTVNCIATGWMDWTPGRGPADIGQNRLLRFIPLKRFGTGEDLAGLAVLLASDAAGYLNGQVFHIDGGVSGHL